MLLLLLSFFYRLKALSNFQGTKEKKLKTYSEKMIYGTQPPLSHLTGVRQIALFRTLSNMELHYYVPFEGKRTIWLIQLFCLAFCGGCMISRIDCGLAVRG